MVDGRKNFRESRNIFNFVRKNFRDKSKKSRNFLLLKYPISKSLIEFPGVVATLKLSLDSRQ